MNLSRVFFRIQTVWEHYRGALNQKQNICQHHHLSVCAFAACVRESSSHMWIYVFLGNALRGIGETPVTPLGISYIDDFAKAENSPFYIGKITLFM